MYAKLTAYGRIPLTSWHIYEIYIFGDKRGIPELYNFAFDLRFQQISQQWTFPTAVLCQVYEKIKEGAPFRRVLVNDAADTREFLDIRKEEHEYLEEFLVCVIEVFTENEMGSRNI